MTVKRIIGPLLLCLLLCGCGGAETGNAVQKQYRTVRTAQMEAEVTSHTSADSRKSSFVPVPDRKGSETEAVLKSS